MPSPSFVNARYADAPGSPIRELKRFMELPGMVSLAGGYPASALMDAAGLQAILTGLSPSDFTRALEYGSTEGSTGLRTELAKLSSLRGMVVDASDVLTLSGSQQGIDLLARTVLTQGDTVLVEAPTYPAAISAFRFAGAEIRQVNTDEEGLVLEDLERCMVEHRPRILYTVPTFGNPSGRTLGEGRRREVLRLAVRHRCLVIEDDPYGDLWFDHPPPAPIYALRHDVAGADEVAVYLSSLSKTLAPGLRLGWMLGPAALRRACVLAKQTDDMHASTLTQAVACAYLSHGHFQHNLPRLRASYRSRAQTLANSLALRLGEHVQFTAPDGGLFVWVRAPGIDTAAWLQAAIARQVMFVPGAAFFAQAPDTACLRLSFASQDEAGIELGVARLAEAFQALR